MAKAWLTGVLLSVVLGILNGCATTPPTRFYLLTALPSPPAAPAKGRNLALGVGPVELPAYLDRVQIATRIGQHELNLAEFDRWGEPLQDNFVRVLAENLGLLVPTEQVVLHPWERGAVDYQVAVQVLRFDYTVGADAVLTARWRILTGDEKELLARKTTYSERPTGQDYPAIVAALDRTLAMLSRDIAAALRTSLPGKK